MKKLPDIRAYGTICGMKFSAAFLLVGILAVGVFGFLGMNPGMDHESGNCIASLVNVVTCPLEGLSNAMYHINAYASFSSAIFFSPLVLLALTLFAFLALASPASFSLLPAQGRLTVRIRQTSLATPRNKFIRWLSLFENSPSFFRSV